MNADGAGMSDADTDNGRKGLQRSTAPAALALIAGTLALIGHVLLVEENFDRRLAVSVYTIAFGFWIWLLDLQRHSYDVPLSARILGRAAPSSGDDSGGHVAWRRLRRSARTSPFAPTADELSAGAPTICMPATSTERRYHGPLPLGSIVKGATQRTRDGIAAEPLAWAALAASSMLTAAVVALLHNRADGEVPHWDVMIMWILAIALYAAAAIRPSRLPSRARLIEEVVVHRQAIVDLALLLAFALLLRVPGLGRWPDVLSGDEGIIGNLSLEFADGKGSMFGTAWAYSSLVFLAHAPLTITVGGIAALRLPDAIIGSLAAPAAYLAGRQMFDRRIGMMAGVLVAALHMHVHLSRIALAHGGDAVLAGMVFFSWMRGIERRDLRWAVLAGIGLGMSQYGYVGGRILGLVVAAYVIVQSISRPAKIARAWRLVVVALGAAVVTAAPMIRLAVDRPNEYMTRINIVGIAQSGTLAATMGETGRPMWLELLHQLREAMLGVMVYPVIDFYGASVPLFNLLFGTLLVLGFVSALWRIEEGRYQLLVLHTGMALLMLALSEDANAAAYRVTGIAVSAAILAAAALKILVEGSFGGSGLPRRTPVFVMSAAVLVIAGSDVYYYFGRHLPACRYTDDATAAASVIASHAAATDVRAPGTTVFALAEPHIGLDHYPSVSYLTRRGLTVVPAEAGSDYLALQLLAEEPYAQIYSLGDGHHLDPQLFDFARPALVIAVPGRMEELVAIEMAVPGGVRERLVRCEETVAESYFVPTAPK